MNMASACEDRGAKLFDMADHASQPVAEPGDTSVDVPLDPSAPAADPATSSEQLESTESSNPKPAKSSICEVCNVNPGKYKCPRCRMPYCSPANPFNTLASSPKLQMLFQKYPHLPDQLLAIHAATQPPRPPARQRSPAPGLPRAGALIKRFGAGRRAKKGTEALKRARNADGEEGEAVREYQELVLHLLAGGDDGARNAMQRHLADQDNALLRSFVAAETRQSKD
ncbi:unnamed protein product [Parascedosporium putredinis]|uniref:HIT-type domain-containing protein n=1 Tax=Parascedosporium putredinis TaxID=1442378 RepID=A0A9P1GYY8_9PEZI|nr:unnamed protein product [Parascedosporium putredinis]CAI7990586.1 unnamed protein product [Parascedosporium putredinis]